jgi:hypothetical protein
MLGKSGERCSERIYTDSAKGFFYRLSRNFMDKGCISILFHGEASNIGFAATSSSVVIRATFVLVHKPPENRRTT